MVTNYFRYFAGGPELQLWGLGVTACGWTRVPRGSPYPPARHPDDHQFDWERGRIIESLQIVFVAEGHGCFESKATGRISIEAGTAFAILPGIWHRYRPSSASGWIESWVEVQGPTIEALLRGNVIDDRHSIRRVVPAAGLEEALDGVHTCARTARGGFDLDLAAAAFAVLTAWHKTSENHPTRSRMRMAIAAAEDYFTQHLAEPVNVAAVALKLGIAYSHFRREFRSHTGLAPWQYVLHLRLSRARRMLASTDITLDDAAERLGFSSGFHLSTMFKKGFGVTPRTWRRMIAAAKPPSQTTPNTRRARPPLTSK